MATFKRSNRRTGAPAVSCATLHKMNGRPPADTYRISEFAPSRWSVAPLPGGATSRKTSHHHARREERFDAHTELAYLLRHPVDRT